MVDQLKIAGLIERHERQQQTATRKQDYARINRYSGSPLLETRESFTLNVSLHPVSRREHKKAAKKKNETAPTTK